MKQVQFIPKVCKQEEGEEPTFQGHITIQCPSFDQRYELIERAGFEMDAEGKMLSGAKQLPAIRKAVKLVGEMGLMQEVALKKISDGSEIKSYEDMTMDPDCDPILIEVATETMNGFRLTKK